MLPCKLLSQYFGVCSWYQRHTVFLATQGNINDKRIGSLTLFALTQDVRAQPRNRSSWHRILPLWICYELKSFDLRLESKLFRSFGELNFILGSIDLLAPPVVGLRVQFTPNVVSLDLSGGRSVINCWLFGQLRVLCRLFFKLEFLLAFLVLFSFFQKETYPLDTLKLRLR